MLLRSGSNDECHLPREDRFCHRGLSFLRSFALSRKSFFLLCVNLDLLVLDVQTKMVIDTHVLVGYPNESEEGDQVSSPIGVEQFEAGDDQEYRCDVMAEAVFTCE